MKSKDILTTEAGGSAETSNSSEVGCICLQFQDPKQYLGVVALNPLAPLSVAIQASDDTRINRIRKRDMAEGEPNINPGVTHRRPALDPCCSSISGTEHIFFQNGVLNGNKGFPWECHESNRSVEGRNRQSPANSLRASLRKVASVTTETP